MKLAYIRLVTEDVAGLTAFYARLLGIEPKGDSSDYTELHPGGAILAICSRQAAAFMHGGAWRGAVNSSAIVEFHVDDVDAEHARVGEFVTDWLKAPKDMPWGNRSTLFRDPDGNVVNLFRPAPAIAQG